MNIQRLGEPRPDAKPKYWDQAANEAHLADFVAIKAPISAHDSITRFGDYLRVWRLDGVAFEAADHDRVKQHHDAMCNVMVNLPAGRCGVYSHRLQFKEIDRLTDPTEPRFSAEFSRYYQDKQAARPMLTKALYFTLLYRPFTTSMGRRLASASSTREAIASREASAKEFLAEKGAIVERILSDFRPNLLGVRQEGDSLYWEQGELFSFLINGVWRKVRFPTGPVHNTLPDVRLSFGGAKVEIRKGSRRRYASILDIKEYASNVEPGSLNSLLYEDFEFIETQSFLSLPKRKALAALEVQRSQLIASGDTVETQIRDMALAIDGLGDGQFQMGEYHYSLAALGDTLEEASDNAAKAIGAVSEGSSIELVDVDLIGDAAWFAQQPGNMKWRPRRANVSSRAFAALSCNHNFLRGKRDGNPWGEALMLLRTPSGQGFYLNLHSSPRDEDSEGKKLPGSTLIIGPNGSGKTSILCSALALTRKWNPAPRLISFSLDRDTEIIIRALGGQFLSFNRNVPTGINPLQREVTMDRLAHWTALVTKCLACDGMALLPSDREQIAAAIGAVARMPAEARWFSTVRQNLPRTGANSLYDRFGRWCRGGEYGWVFDMAPDQLINLKQVNAMGFDYTGVMANEDVKTPIMMELLDVMNGLLGTPLIYHVAEAWKALSDSIFSPFLKTSQKTIRKKDGLGIFDTQEVGDLLSNENGRTMIEQSITKIFLPNAAASRTDYVLGAGLTESEFDLVVSLGATGSRRFLLKQGDQSVLCEFDLSGADDMLTVLSATTDNVELLDEIRAQVGDNPDDWLPVLYRRARENRSRKIRRVA